MPTSLYNNARNQFRRRNEDTAGSPSDKAKTQETGAKGQKKHGPPKDMRAYHIIVQER